MESSTSPITERTLSSRMVFSASLSLCHEDGAALGPASRAVGGAGIGASLEDSDTVRRGAQFASGPSGSSFSSLPASTSDPQLEATSPLSWSWPSASAWLSMTPISSVSPSTSSSSSAKVTSSGPLSSLELSTRPSPSDESDDPGVSCSMSPYPQSLPSSSCQPRPFSAMRFLSRIIWAVRLSRTSSALFSFASVASRLACSSNTS
mmetsp:Transcript_5196/g.14867  ORF Transcript_5196/g.14867 Transcript_5196/m.14867 type:complete len:206 (-) Transcript_5196:1261-1878(-)